MEEVININITEAEQQPQQEKIEVVNVFVTEEKQEIYPVKYPSEEQIQINVYESPKETNPEIIIRDGKNAYQIWLENGNTGTISDFLLSLKGADGQSSQALDRKHVWNSPYSYNGKAPAGSNINDSVWTITRLGIDSAGVVITTDTVTNVKWSDYLTITY